MGGALVRRVEALACPLIRWAAAAPVLPEPAMRRHLRPLAMATIAATLSLPASHAGADTTHARSTATSTAAPAPAEVVAARQYFFGAENVDPITGVVRPGEVHLSWVSVATFAAAVDGHVVLFDAYIHKQEDRPNYVPATTQDLVDLAPEAIFVGHAHFDHALDSGPIAAATGAVVVGTQSHCDQARASGGDAVRCEVVFSDLDDFGAVREFDVFDDVCTSAVLHVHSAAEPPDPDHDHTSNPVPIPDAGTVLLHPPGPGFMFDAAGDEGGTVLYQLRIGDFALTYHDSSGPLKEQAPQVFDVLRGLPQTDVQVGAILGFNQPFNGLRDPAMYIEALRPTVFVPNHHDFVTEYGSSDDFEPVLLGDLEAMGVETEVRFLYDPFDYVRPNLLSYRIDDARWDRGLASDACPKPRTAASLGAAPIAAAPAANAALPATGGGLGFLAMALAGFLAGRGRSRPGPQL